MRTLYSMLALALAVALLAAPAQAKTKKKAPQKEAAAEDLDRRGFYDDEAASHLRRDGDQEVNRYDVAVFVSRALDILARSRGGSLLSDRQEVDNARSLTTEMHGEAAEIGSRIDNLNASERDLHADIQKLLEKRNRR